MASRLGLFLALAGVCLAVLAPGGSAALHRAFVRLPDDPSPVFSDNYFDVTEYTHSLPSKASSGSTSARRSPFGASLAESTARAGVSASSQAQALTQSQAQAQTQTLSQSRLQKLSLGSIAKGLGSAMTSGASAVMNGFLQQNGPTPGDVEDCMACQFVWAQVEMDVGNTQLQQSVYDAFHRNCAVAGKTPIFYPACQAMADMVDDLIGDYIQGNAVSQICTQNFLCRDALRQRSQV